jgi:hypothetical protein
MGKIAPPLICLYSDMNLSPRDEDWNGPIDYPHKSNELDDSKKCPSCLAGFSKEDIAGNCTCTFSPSKRGVQKGKLEEWAALPSPPPFYIRSWRMMAIAISMRPTSIMRTIFTGFTPKIARARELVRPKWLATDLCRCRGCISTSTRYRPGETRPCPVRQGALICHLSWRRSLFRRRIRQG